MSDQTLRSTLEAIEQREPLTPQAVLAEASDPASPIHDRFTWDDGTAARRWRLWEARQLIRRVKVTVQTNPEETVRVRAFVNIPHAEGAGEYVSTTAAMADPTKRDVVLQQAMRELAAFKRRYSHLIDVSQVIRDVLLDEAA